MTPHKVLLVSHAPAENEAEIEVALTDYHLIRVPGHAEGLAAVSMDGIDCVLIAAGSLSCADACDTLNMFQSLDPLMPVIFWDPEIRATDAVRLVRAGAHHCIGHGDSHQELQDSVASAI